MRNKNISRNNIPFVRGWKTEDETLTQRQPRQTSRRGSILPFPIPTTDALRPIVNPVHLPVRQTLSNFSF